MRVLIPLDWHVPGLFAKRLGDTLGRQRAMTAEGHLLLVLHEPPLPGVPERTGRLFWRDPEGMWKSKGLGDGPQALKQHVAKFTEQVEGFEKQWQTATGAEDYYRLLRDIAPFHRTARNLYATLQQARDLVPEDRDLINLRDQVGEVDRAIELLHADARNGLDFTVAHQIERQVERTYEMAVAAHRLNVLAATFFPIATLSAIYSAIFGMILAHGSHSDHEWSSPALFWGFLGLGLVCGLVLGKIIGRKPPPPTRPVVKGKAKRR